MDKFNIISPTTDIDELDKDMANWCMLPYELRMRSNDDCMRLYGVTVVDLYNNMKDKILNVQDLRKIEPSNIVKESLSEEYDKYDVLLAASKKLQQSAYIVILDPDITNIDELNQKYYSYILLNDNNKILSDTYSWKLWGRSVYSMYIKLAATIPLDNDRENPEYIDDSNIVFSSESVSRIENCIFPVVNLINEAELEHDIISSYKYRRNIASENNSILENTIINKKLNSNKTSFNCDILPKVVPWFTANEFIEIDKSINVDNFYKVLKTKLAEKDSEEKEKSVLSYGWNPSVPLSPEAIQYARERQIDYLNNIDIINLKNLDTNDINIKANPNLYPVFFVFEYTEEVNDFTRLPEYNKVGIILKNDMSTVYTLRFENDTFQGCMPESIYKYKFIDMVVAYIEREPYIQLLDNLANINQKAIKTNFNSVFDILSKSSNTLSPDAMKSIYMKYIYMVFKIINVDTPIYKMENNINIFKVFSGHSKEFTKDAAMNIFNKLNVISNNASLEKAVVSSVGESANELISRLTPKSFVKNIE